jgi:transcriptional regulator
VAEHPRVVLSVHGDSAYIPSSWKAVGDEDPRLGIPTAYDAAVQLVGTATVVDEPGPLAALLRAQLADLQPDEDVADPSAHGPRLRGIRGLRVAVDEVRAKFMYGGNADAEHRAAVAERLRRRGGPGDADALAHLARRDAAAVPLA